MRIVGGEFRGRSLAAPKGQAIRPTTDRTRESLFNILASRIDLEGSRVIDLFAGTGALGLEALSRGAAFALFVDASVEGRSLIRTNIEALGLTGRTQIFRRDASKLGAIGTMQPFDLAFADPPYGTGLGERAARTLAEGGWLNEDALLVLEEARGHAPSSLPDFVALDRREFGDSVLGFFEPTSHPSQESNR
ncbi:MAG: 16S rRNA (guanine(966)-N(2))-methyltransferase RsmD [Salaquimonas sp.]|nr:16S rRNA (guanine(966)-N(2))-methyltransferase RsmD [Salaquimonas sp.]